jgi:hypothetical protein
MVLNKGLVAVVISRSSRWFRVIIYRALIWLAHGLSILYFIDFSILV